MEVSLELTEEVKELLEQIRLVLPGLSDEEALAQLLRLGITKKGG